MQGTKTSGQSALAAGLEPPQEKKFGSAITLIGISLFLFLSPAWIIGILVAGIGVFMFYKTYTYNNGEHKSQLATWQKTYLCGRCAKVFMLDENNQG